MSSEYFWKVKVPLELGLGFHFSRVLSTTAGCHSQRTRVCVVKQISKPEVIMRTDTFSFSLSSSHPVGVEGGKLSKRCEISLGRILSRSQSTK